MSFSPADAFVPPAPQERGAFGSKVPVIREDRFSEVPAVGATPVREEAAAQGQ